MGTRTVSQIINLKNPNESVERYITDIGSSGISIHPIGDLNNKVNINNGLEIILNGDPVASYGTKTTIGKENNFHISLSGTRLGFWKGTEEDSKNEIAYISGQQLYITKSVVLQQMDLGTPIAQGGADALGQWSWKVHPNREVPPKNNLNLKWIG